jgi:predicted glycoside hydrolase/deacetylase ChbG (UPF0249 family)
VKRLIVNADDFGFTRDVNAGIVEAHRHGILTATTIMANGGAFADAVRLAKENPSLDVGVHLVLVGGPGQAESVVALLANIARGGVDIAGEMRKQVASVIGAGLAPSHLDTHKHTHLAPPVLKAMIEISREFGIPWVRKPADFTMPASAAPPLKKAVNAIVRSVANRFDQVLQRNGCRFTDHFTGFELTGRMGTKEMVELIEHLPDGLTELMCHPGFFRDELRASRTRLREARERELRALISPEVRQAIFAGDVQLTSYRDL